LTNFIRALEGEKLKRYEKILEMKKKSKKKKGMLSK
jgi:hypothetical protein